MCTPEQARIIKRWAEEAYAARLKASNEEGRSYTWTGKENEIYLTVSSIVEKAKNKKAAA